MKKDVKNAIRVVIQSVRNMAIYTRTGDDGTTGLFGGKRLSKADIQIEAYGSLDELASVLGMFILQIDNVADATFLQEIQRDLYVIMGYLANAPTDFEKLSKKSLVFERKIDSLSKSLPPLTDFILPGGTLSSSWAHIARVTCRQSERLVVGLFQKNKTVDQPHPQLIIKYLNRLSDLLFTYARFLNRENEILSKNE